MTTPSGAALLDFSPSLTNTSPGQATAIVIDDSFTMRNVLKAGLQRAGIRVVAEGSSGEELLPLYEKHRPSLVTLDVILPELDGVSAAKGLLEKYPDAHVIMCSSLTDRAKIIACRDAGVAYFLLKPFTLEKVVEISRSVLERVTKATAGAVR